MGAWSLSPEGMSGGTGLFHLPGYSGGQVWNMSTGRIKIFGHNGSSSTQNASFHVSNDFGMSRTGGYVFMGFHGWANDHAAGIIEWRNGGSSGGITGSWWMPFISDNGVSISTGHDSDQTVTIQLTNTHTNGHGWQWSIWSPR